MKKLIYLIFFFLVPYGLNAQSYIKSISELLKEKKFDAALDFGTKEIKQLKASNKFDRQLEILTYLSLCMNPETQVDGCSAINDYFNSHLKSLQYLSYFNGYKLFTGQICAGARADTIPIVDKIGTYIIHSNAKSEAGTYSHFKSYERLNRYANFNSLIRQLTLTQMEKILTYNEPESQGKAIETMSDATGYGYLDAGKKRDTLETPYQLFLTNSPPDSVQRYAVKIFATSNVVRSSHLVVLSKTATKQSLNVTSGILEKTLNFYSTVLHIPMDKHLIFVYLSNSFKYIGKDIDSINHGGGKDGIIGFSNTEANTVFGWIPASDQPGTIKHELIHILLKNNVLIPDWFEEGLAALYEESRFASNGQLLGINNWRLSFLRYMNQIQLDQLFDDVILSQPDQESTLTKDITQQVNAAIESLRENDPTWYGYLKDDLADISVDLGINYVNLCEDAISRYFVAYLQSKGKLPAVINGLILNQDNAFSKSRYLSFHKLLMKTLLVSDDRSLKVSFFSWLKLQMTKPNGYLVKR